MIHQSRCLGATRSPCEEFRHLSNSSRKCCPGKILWKLSHHWHALLTCGVYTSAWPAWGQRFHSSAWWDRRANKSCLAQSPAPGPRGGQGPSDDFLYRPVKAKLTCAWSGWGCSSVGRASDWHAAGAGSILGQGIFLSESTFSADFFMVSVHPRLQLHALTSVRTLKVL